MRIGGLQKVSLIDYPGLISAVVFTQGCNFRCPYCHNPELVDPYKFGKVLLEKDIFTFLDRRVGKLDGVVITGGEPTVQKDLADFIKKIKSIGYLVKLDTNGFFPDVVESLLAGKLIDYIAMDIKAPIGSYQRVAGISSFNSQKTIERSIKLIMDAPIDYEFRTTVVKSILSAEDLYKIAKMITGARLYALQRFKPTKVLKKSYLKKKSYSAEELEEIAAELKKSVKEVIVR